MNRYRVRIFIRESFWTDVVVQADGWVQAQMLGQGQSPIGKAIFLGEAY